MTPDQRETHCGDSGVKLDGTKKRILFRGPTDEQQDTFMLDLMASYAADGYEVLYEKVPSPFPEAATDPWEEQGCD